MLEHKKQQLFQECCVFDNDDDGVDCVDGKYFVTQLLRPAVVIFTHTGAGPFMEYNDYCC